MSPLRASFGLLSLILVFAGGTLAACGQDAPPANALARPTAASAGPAQVSEAQTVPDAFLGEWNMRREDCGGHLNDSRLVISAQELELYESSGEVESTAIAEDTLTVKARMSGEGATWDETYRFRPHLRGWAGSAAPGTPVLGYGQRCQLVRPSSSQHQGQGQSDAQAQAQGDFAVTLKQALLLKLRWLDARTGRRSESQARSLP